MHGTPSLTLEQLTRLFSGEYDWLAENGYFREHFGFWDRKWNQGRIQGDIAAYVLLILRKDGLWPIDEKVWAYSEEDIFDMIEFLHDHVSMRETMFSDYDEMLGRAEFRKRMNPLLEAYSEGYELTNQGKIEILGEVGLKELFSAKLPTEDSRIAGRVEEAVRVFRDRHSDDTARRSAVRELADVCELLRPRIKKLMRSEDENDLFNVANNYAVRHLNDIQKAEYSTEWRSWMFYLYLSTIHLTLRLMKRESNSPRAGE
jgi:hypothetical protein